MKKTFKPWDVVRTPKGAIAVITETDGTQASIEFLPNQVETYEKNAWWHISEKLTVLGSLITLLVNATAHPFGQNTEQGDNLFQQET
jgi:hypothetical protein